MFDPVRGSYDILQSRIPVETTTFTATGLTAGNTYKFKVQSENEYGFSDYSNQVVILAAQKPSAPPAPVTSISGLNVKIEWGLSSDNGSPITGYTIYIQKYNSLEFAIEWTNCNGTETTIRTTRTCYVPINILRGSTYNHPWGASIYAKVVATNIYGLSDESAVGNGATILTVPDAPLNVVEVVSMRAATSITISW